ncbi:MAG: DUF2306 domain-containing protein [Saprospiraceae bacterium]|nr:DUF2306 domain-containing protein [Saprospiraceae bacterium]
MTQIAHDSVGWIHVLASVIAMISGAVVITSAKGTRRHKLLGYVFVGSMLCVLVTAMLIYRLFGRVGPFHVFALIGFVYLAIGIIPALRRSPNWLNLHIRFMYWSVVGLYAAFVAEIGVRIPNTPFWGAVIVAVLIVTVTGAVFYGKYRASWRKVLDQT